jgi:protein SCO1/2
MKQPGWIRNTLIGIVLIGIFAAGLWLGIKREVRQQAQLIQLDPMTILLGEPRPLKAFHLVTHRGESFSVESLRGLWTMVFFGYTYCPDICPTTLVTLQASKARLEAMGPTIIRTSSALPAARTRSRSSHRVSARPTSSPLVTIRTTISSITRRRYT